MRRGDLLLEVGGRPAGVVAQVTDDDILVRRHGTIPLPQGWQPVSDPLHEFEAARKKVEALGWEVRVWRSWDGRRDHR